jgi:hypothetical protein
MPVLLAGVFVCAGCRDAGPELGEVRGRVTLDGKPVPDAFVRFTPDFAGRPSMARTDAEGYYELQFNPTSSGALVGQHQVRVSTEDLTPDDKRIPEIVPTKYNRNGSITVEVAAGDNEIDLELESD